ncbi:MAG: DoxX family protein [Flavobacteriaceae bacterium]|nr:DoxX family protein [Flavobacteriaceae bacterium]
MKILVTISRIIVGVLFIFSGLIKLNDPLGFSYKLVEYFEEGVLNLPFLIPYALMIAVIVVIFEVLLGVFLLIGYKVKFTVWSLLAMIIFFTFLTFYSAYFEKVKDCGCFGDAIPLTPWESFYKDLILLVLIVILVVGAKYINPIMTKLGRTIVALLSFIACLSFGYYVLMHLPAIDFRAYHIGANIKEKMSVPDNAPKAIIDYHWKYLVDGEEKVFTTRGQAPNVDGELLGVETDEIRPPYIPPIQDFSIEKDGEDFTEQFLNEPKLVMVVMYNLDNIEAEGMYKLSELESLAKSKGYEIIGLSASGEAQAFLVKEKYNLGFDFYLCDEKALKTIVRSNPGVLVLHNGTIMDKEHWNDLDDLDL